MLKLAMRSNFLNTGGRPSDINYSACDPSFKDSVITDLPGWYSNDLGLSVIKGRNWVLIISNTVSFYVKESDCTTLNTE